MKTRILIIDDEPDMLGLLRRIITENTAHEVVTESKPAKALARIEETPFDIVITDLKMPEMDGIELLEVIHERWEEIVVIVVTAFATIETAVEAIRKGAFDYLTKPFRKERILLTIEKAMAWRALSRENQELKAALDDRDESMPMVTVTPAMQSLCDRIRQVAATSATVLITGPSGTGKELVARAIHQNSPRRGRKMVTVNCTALPEQVIESELFGHVRGAFTGAWKDKKGLVELADAGTLFLDEIGDLSPNLQTKLLRLLQEGEYKPVGAEHTRRADIRFVAATNHDLKADIRENRFREDLYYRLNVIHFRLPPLHERKKDIPLLAYHFLKKYTDAHGKKIRDISQAAFQALSDYDFPGNVRELENMIERGVIYCTSDTLSVRDLFMEETDEAPLPEPTDSSAKGYLSFKDAKERMLQTFHERYIRELLNESGGNISKAAELAGIQRQYLHRLIKELGIDTDPFKNG